MRREKAVKRMARKLNRTAGFTLAETLMAILILLMVSAVVAGGLPAAMNAYHKAVDAANAQLLLSTTVNALRDELSTAWNVEAAGETITYQSADTGSKSKIFKDDNGRIMLQEYVKESELGWLETSVKSGDERPLVSNAMMKSIKGSTNDMTVTYSTAEVKDDNGEVYVIITGLEVKSATGATAAKMPGGEKVLLIRVLTGGETT